MDQSCRIVQMAVVVLLLGLAWSGSECAGESGIVVGRSAHSELHFYCKVRSGICEIAPDGSQRLLIRDVSPSALEVHEGEIYFALSQIRVYDLNGVRQREIPLPDGVRGALVCLPENRYALLNNNDDMIYVVDSAGGLLASRNMLHPPDEGLQNVHGVVAGDFLYVSEDGNRRVLRMNLSTYEVSLYRDLGTLWPWLGALAWGNGAFYVCDPETIYRITDTEGPTAVASIGAGTIGGLQINWPVAYVSTRSAGTIERVNLQTGSMATHVAGIDAPDSLAMYRRLVTSAKHWHLYP